MASVAYLDPPYSSYFHQLAGRLAKRCSAQPLALLSSPAYRPYAGGDRALVWPGGQMDDPPPLPPDSKHAIWSQTNDREFRAAFWHAVAWFRDQLRANDVQLLLIFSDARPFSLAAETAARELGVRWIYFERGALRFRTASLSATGLNGRFHLRRVREDDAIRGVLARETAERRPRERRIKRRFARFILENAWACLLAPERRRLQHKRYRLGAYVRLQCVQWWSHYLGPYHDRHLRIEPGRPLVAVPLQLPGDSQLRLYSPFETNQQFLDFVCSEVRRVAPQAQFVVRRHPMDVSHYTMPPGALNVMSGIEQYFNRDPLVICVNSTVGFDAATRGLQVICLGPSFYTEGNVVALATPQDLARHVCERLGRARDRAAGAALRAAVLRWYQAPGDAWAFTHDDLARTVQIIGEHCAGDEPVSLGCSP